MTPAKLALSNRAIPIGLPTGNAPYRLMPTGTIAQVAALAGFASTASFCAAFRSVTSLTPTAFLDPANLAELATVRPDRRLGGSFIARHDVARRARR